MSDSIIQRALRTMLHHPGHGPALLAYLDSPPTEHLDDEAMAALLEGETTPAQLAHLLSCAVCAELGEELFSLEKIVPFAEVQARATLEPERRVLFASLEHRDESGWVVVGGAGSSRVRAALGTRALGQDAGLAFRDRADDPRLEVGVVPVRPGRWHLMVRWLDDVLDGLRARLLVDGRVRAESRFTDGSALFDDVAARSLRIDVLRERNVLGSAWLRVAP